MLKENIRNNKDMISGKIKNYSISLLVLVTIFTSVGVTASEAADKTNNSSSQELKISPSVHNLTVSGDFRDVTSIETSNYGVNVTLPLPSKVTYIKGKSFLQLPVLDEGSYQLNSKSGKYLLIVGDGNSDCKKNIKIAEYRCFADKYLTILSKNSNINSLLTEVKNEKLKDPVLNSVCSNLLQAVGRLYVLKNKKTPTNITPELATQCDNGFIHGSQQGLILLKDNNSIANLANTICSSDKFYQQAGNCNQGIGYMLYHKMGDYKLAMKYCEVLKLDGDQVNCADGVAMRYAIDYHNAFYKKDTPNYQTFNTITKPLDLCNQFKSLNVKKGCYSNMDFFYTDKSGTENLKKECDSLDQQFGEFCYIALGRLLALKSTAQVAMDKCINDKNSQATIRCSAQAISFIFFVQPGRKNLTEDFCAYYKSKKVDPKVCVELRNRSKFLVG